MRPLDLADPDWLAATLRRHHRDLGLSVPPARIDLLDVRIRHPHRPESARCRGWATVRVADEQVFLLRSDDLDAEGRGGTAVPGLPIRVWRFPADPALPALPAITDPERARRLLPGDLAADHHVEQVGVVKWQPGESATVRCSLAGPCGRRVLYAKLLAAGDVDAVDALQRTLFAERPDGLAVAEPLGAAEANGILWTREAVGRPLAAVLGEGSEQLDPVARRTGRCLAALHASVVDPGRLVQHAEVATEAAKKARKIAVASPQHEPAVRRLAELTTALADATAYEPSPLHGDFHIDQILLGGRGLVLLDLDEMVTGDPALDLAELGVDLLLRRLPSATAHRFLGIAGESYEQARGTFPRREILRAYAAAELLNRCYRHLRRPVPGWAAALGQDLAVADSVLSGVDRMTDGVRT